MTDTPLVFHIQKFSLHDGDGIRTTVFFKGCPLSCVWCHNPEGVPFAPQLMYTAERCLHCKTCAGCDTACTACGKCVERCPGGARELAGRAYTVDELVGVLLEDLPFYRQSHGGVTLSGGEAMAQQPAYLMALLGRLHDHGVSLAVDTCGYAPYDRFLSVLPYVDTFLYDVKAIDPALHRRLTGADNALILENLRRLSLSGARIRVRIPVVAGANAGEIPAIAQWMADNGIRAEGVHLLPYHAMGADKARRLGTAQTRFSAPTEEMLSDMRQAFALRGYQTTTGG